MDSLVIPATIEGIIAIVREEEEKEKRVFSLLEKTLSFWSLYGLMASTIATRGAGDTSFGED